MQAQPGGAVTDGAPKRRRNAVPEALAFSTEPCRWSRWIGYERVYLATEAAVPGRHVNDHR